MFRGHRSHPSLLKVPKSFRVLVVVLVFLYSVVCGMVLVVRTHCSVVRGVVLMVLTSCLVVLDYYVYHLIIISSNYEQLLGTTGTTPWTTKQLARTTRTMPQTTEKPIGTTRNMPQTTGTTPRFTGTMPWTTDQLVQTRRTATDFS